MNIQLGSLFKKRTSQTAVAQADICLIAYDEMLLHAEKQNLIAQHDESLLRLTPKELAQAARRLLPNTDKQQRIALALPCSEFVATPVNVPSVAAQTIKSVVNLQFPTLLPGVSEPLLLAVQANPEADNTIALWIPSRRAEELFHAFDAVGLFLNVLLPRPLVAMPESQAACRIYDEDETSMTYCQWTGQNLTHWYHIPKADYELPDFKQQFDKYATQLDESTPLVSHENSSAWENVAMPNIDAYSYAFIPPSAVLQQNLAVKKRKKNIIIALAGLCVLALLSAAGGFIYYKKQLKEELQALKGQTLNISQLQSEVFAIEDDLAPITEFPRQNVKQVLAKLNRLIPKDSWITSFKLEAGTVEVEGYSPNPAKLLELLSQEPKFIGVGFNRATQREGKRDIERFGISFKLEDIDVNAYWLEYFPVE